jgi:hypothetical protein
MSLSLARIGAFVAVGRASVGAAKEVLPFNFGKDSFEAMKINWLERESDFF